MSKNKHISDTVRTNSIMNNPISILILSVLIILMGSIFVFSQSSNKPISREEALSFSGNFDYYDAVWESYRDIYFEDGSCYSVYAHTETTEFFESMKSLEKGTKLYILINPNNNYVVEVKTDTQELLNFELSQKAIDSYDNGYIAIGIFCIVGGSFFIIYAIGAITYKRKEDERCAERKSRENDVDSNPIALRDADMSIKSRTLIETSIESYKICYRRVKFVNELVINGKVYDEKKGIIEFEHKLCTALEGHVIEAGCDDAGYSYITFDGDIIEYKRRWI